MCVCVYTRLQHQLVLAPVGPDGELQPVVLRDVPGPLSRRSHPTRAAAQEVAAACAPVGPGEHLETRAGPTIIAIQKERALLRLHYRRRGECRHVLLRERVPCRQPARSSDKDGNALVASQVFNTVRSRVLAIALKQHRKIPRVGELLQVAASLAALQCLGHTLYQRIRLVSQEGVAKGGARCDGRRRRRRLGRRRRLVPRAQPAARPHAKSGTTTQRACEGRPHESAADVWLFVWVAVYFRLLTIIITARQECS